MDPELKNLDKELQERFARLPKVVQDAINSSDVEKHLRDLAHTHKLHVDQWETLENEVMFALLAFKPAENLKDNIKNEVVVSEEVAVALAEDISKTVFEPIRQELERQLEHPEAKAVQVSGVEAARSAVLSSELAPEPLASKDLPPPSVPPPSPKSTSATAASAPAGTPAPTPTIAPATPAVSAPTPAAPQGVVSRTPTTTAYQTGEASTARKNVHDDPYREAPN